MNKFTNSVLSLKLFEFVLRSRSEDEYCRRITEHFRHEHKKRHLFSMFFHVICQSSSSFLVFDSIVFRMNCLAPQVYPISFDQVLLYTYLIEQSAYVYSSEISYIIVCIERRFTSRIYITQSMLILFK